MRDRERENAEKARRWLERALENIDKRQYWNALCWINEAERFTMDCFDAILKDE